ncbi:TetR/AcrR family transcriptional regulator [Pseudomonas syringae]|uniref:TetR/AcrR family transcriptional regulator n=1 Tax=Pseudomonas syringae TaxID=317 RepID=UPI0004204A9F|nr:TetR/AcrR family transcriptional regulator [Pseudomonas syringae]
MKARTEARRLAIVEVAAGVFLDLGYDGTSMTEVSRRLGGSKATLYGYFRCKEDLFSAVVKMYATSHLYDALTSLLQSADDIALHESLVRFGRKMMKVLTHDSKAINVYRLVLSESGRSDIGKRFHDTGPSQCVEALSDLMSRAMANGELTKACPRLRARQFLSLLTAETGERLFQQEPAPMPMSEVEMLVNQAVGMFLGGAQGGK